MHKDRASSRVGVSLRAAITVSGNAPAISCIVRNLSEGGACLEMATTAGIPPTFRLSFENTCVTCRVIWRTQANLGVTFKPAAPAMSPQDLDVGHPK
jgi:PilZ domain